jgi:lipopolysaccharide/colanic/teichoic acid biosynthesis glycosyltransferase
MKRLFDIFLSSLGLILSSPLWLLFSLAIKLEDRGPVFYRQERVGKGGRIFNALKFRSMIKDAEKESGPVQAIENDPRVTKIGRILRATAMDELPQLLNIFKGDMSFVGPRALRPKEKEVHGNPDETNIEDIPAYKDRLTVRPGLTGLAQVYLPTDALRSEKFKYDLLYIKKQSFLLDLKLIFLSFWITFRGKWESRQKKY